MKRIFQLISISIIAFIFIEQVVEQDAFSNINGANPKITGSPFDISGQTCSQTDCHSGGATQLDGIITSNIPVDGYVPGTTYTVTITVSDPDKTRFGFEISPEDATGLAAGTIVITDAARTHFTNPNIQSRYLTHTLAGTDAPTHTNIWSFDWLAPESGKGEVTFYACLNYTNRDSTVSGDNIHTTTLTVNENPNGINDPLIISSLNLYPNPVMDAVQLDYYLQKQETVVIDLMDASGRIVKELFSASQSSGAHHNSFPLNGNVSSGIYLVKLTAGDQTMLKKVIVL